MYKPAKCLEKLMSEKNSRFSKLSHRVFDTVSNVEETSLDPMLLPKHDKKKVKLPEVQNLRI